MAGMYPRLYKRGKYWHVELARNRRKTLGLTSERDAKKAVKKIVKKELAAKIAQLDARERICISEFIPVWTGNIDRSELSQRTLEMDDIAFNLLKDAIGDVPLRLIDREEIRMFKKISVRRVKQSSVNSYLRHIKSGLNWAKQDGYIPKVPHIKMFKTGEHLTRYLSKEDVKILLSHAKKKKPEMHRIIKFALYTGARREEIIKSRYEHIQGTKIKIIGKGNKERLIPLLPQALEERQDIGKIFQYKHKSTVSNYFRELSRECSVKARFHDLRHTAGTQMLASGIDLKTVKEILGHADIRTTEIYAQVLAETMEKEMQKLSYD